MIRQIWHLIRQRKKNAENTEYAEVPAEKLSFSGQYDWGRIEIRLDVEQGVIREAAASSDGADLKLIELIGAYLTGRKYERKEVLKTLDMIPVNNEQENTVMRDVYNLLDDQIFQ